MSCNCINDWFEVGLDSLNPSTIVLRDLSDWTDKSGQGQYTLTVEIDHSSRKFPVTLTQGGSTVISFKEVHGFEGCFPNSFVCISCEVCGVGYRKYLPLLGQLDCKLDELVAKSSNPKELQTALYLRGLRESLTAAIKFQKIPTARSLFTQLNAKLKNQHCGNCPN